MAKPKKSGKKSSVKVKDMPAKEDPKGGAFDAFLKIDGIKGESMTQGTSKPTVKRTTKTLA